MFIIILVVFMVFAWILEAYSLEYSDIKKIEDISPETIKDADNSSQKFMKPDTCEAEKAFEGFIKAQDIEIKSNDLGQMVIKDNQDTPLSFLSDKSASAMNGKIYFFFSFSLPPHIIKQAILDAIKLNKEKKAAVTLVLRGLVNNDLRKTFETFYTFRKENLLYDSDFPVEINPDLFTKYSVSHVPYIVYESGANIGMISGTGISFAVSQFDKELKDYGKYGDTYQIAEDDFLKFLEARANSPEVKYKLKNAFKSAGRNMYRLSKYDGQFVKAEKDREYKIDPRVTVTDDIRDHQGNVIFSKGSVFNPADYVFMTGKYIFIDGRDEEQVAYALKGDYRKIILTSGDILELSKKYKHAFFFINDILIERFQLTHVPAILEQEGGYYRVTEKALN